MPRLSYFGLCVPFGAACLFLSNAAFDRSAYAGGLEFPSNGVQSMGRAGAFIARADDNTAFWHNPAGLAKLRGFQGSVSTNIIFGHMGFDRDGNYPASTGAAYEGKPFPAVSSDTVGVIPMLGLSYGIGQKMTAALSFGAPHGAGKRLFPETVTVDGVAAPAPQRYDNYSGDSKIFFPTASFAYRVAPKLDIGAGVMWGVALIRTYGDTWGTINPTEDPGQDAKTRLSANDYFVPAFNIGLLYRPTPAIELGAVLKSGASIQASGKVIGIFGKTLADAHQKLVARAPCTRTEEDAACADIKVKLPMKIGVGGRYRFLDADRRERGDIELDLVYELWSSVDSYYVSVLGRTPTDIQDQQIVHAYNNSFSARVGGSWNFGKVAVRGGLAFDSSAVDLGHTRIDADAWAKLTTALGASYPLGRFTVEGAFAYVHDFPRTVGTGDGKNFPIVPVVAWPYEPGTVTITNEGSYDAHNVVLALGLRFALDPAASAQ